MKQAFIMRFCQLTMFVVFSTGHAFPQSSATDTNGSPNSSLSNPTEHVKEAVLRADGETFLSESGSKVEALSDRSTAGLPDMPRPILSDRDSSNPNFEHKRNPSSPAPAGAGADSLSNWQQWAVTGAVFGSNIAAIELLHGCLADKLCQSVPGPMRSRTAMYGVGLPIATGVSYLGFRLKKIEKPWWFVPGVAATSFDLVFVVGAGRRVH